MLMVTSDRAQVSGKVKICKHLLYRAQHSALGDYSVPVAIIKHIINSEDGGKAK